MKNLDKENATRLVRVLSDHADDIRVITALSHYLNYCPDQLQKDIKALSVMFKK